MASNRDGGFTLIEIVITMAIIVVLMTLLFGVASKQKERAQLTQCISQLKSIHAAIVQYSTDHDGRIPANRDPYIDPNNPAIARERLTDEVMPGYIDLPAYLNEYIDEKCFLCPINRKHRDMGYYLDNVGSSYWYFGNGQLLDGKDFNGNDFPLSKQKLLGEISIWHDGKCADLYADGHVLAR